MSLLQEETPDKHGVDSGRVEAAHGIARGTHQGLAEQVEGGIVEHRQTGSLAGGMQQLPVERVILLRERYARGPGRRSGRRSKSGTFSFTPAWDRSLMRPSELMPSLLVMGILT